MKKLWFGLLALVLVCSLKPVAGQNSPAEVTNQQKVLFAVGEGFAEVDWTSYFGEKEANQVAFKRLEASLADLGEPKLLDKVRDAEKQCISKGCKSTIPPLSHAVKEWTHMQKRLGTNAAYSAMGTGVGTVAFYIRFAPKLHPTLRQGMISAGMTATNFASNACTLAAGCPASVHDAFEQLNAGLGDRTLTNENAEKLLATIRQDLGLSSKSTKAEAQ